MYLFLSPTSSPTPVDSPPKALHILHQHTPSSTSVLLPIPHLNPYAAVRLDDVRDRLVKRVIL